MNRLTTIDGCGHNDLIRCMECHNPGADNENCGLCEHFQQMIDCLAAYKNTGLEPEEVAELVKATQDGRLIMLPCRVGDTVYTNSAMQGWYLRDKDRPYSAKVTFIGINGERNFINVELGKGKQLSFNYTDFGKTVFLTREEAKKALEDVHP